MNILSFQGRINRLQYFLVSVILAVVMGGLLIALVGMAALSHGIVTHTGGTSFAQYMQDVHNGHNAVYTSQSFRIDGHPAVVFALAVSGLGLLLTWIGVAAQAKRFHDMGQSGWFVLLNLLPGAGFFVWLVLVLASGQSSPNTYGPQLARP
jgi:uncharacterized membrane protein YhaH (DUF805 family)